MNSTDFVRAFSHDQLKDGQHSASLSVRIEDNGTRVLYNYGTPIAFVTPDGTRGLNTEKYSATTSKHQNRVRYHLESDEGDMLTSSEVEAQYGIRLHDRLGMRSTSQTVWDVA